MTHWAFYARGGINPGLSKWTKRKSFELNVEIGVELAIAAVPRRARTTRRWCIQLLEAAQSDYQSRIADDRVGYFVTAHRDWSAD